MHEAGPCGSAVVEAENDQWEVTGSNAGGAVVTQWEASDRGKKLQNLGMAAGEDMQTTVLATATGVAVIPALPKNWHATVLLVEQGPEK